VGKSTTAVSLGAALAEMGYRVLVVDLDPQGNASTGLGIRHDARDTTVYDVLVTEAPAEDSVVPTVIEGLDVIPSTIDLAGAEIELVSQFSREMRLKKALAGFREGVYDFIFLDCPPSLGLLTVNALTAAEELIVPIQCEYYALEGLGQLLRNVSLVQQNINPELRLAGIVMTMFDPRTKLSEQVVAEVQRFFGEVVYDVIIPRTVRLSEAPGYGQPITIYDPKSRGAECYRELAREVASRPPPSEPMPVFDELPSVVVAPVDDAVIREPIEDPSEAVPTVHEVMADAASVVEEAEATDEASVTDEAAATEEAAVTDEAAATEEAAAATTGEPERAAAKPRAKRAKTAEKTPDESKPTPVVDSPREEAEVWLEELAADTQVDDGSQFLKDAVDEVVHQMGDEGVVDQIGDDDLWDEVEEQADPGSRVSAPRTPQVPGRLPERRVVVIDEQEVDKPTVEDLEPAPADPTEDIGSTLQDESQPKRKWRLFRGGR
jgi:chromosome partitioning protein